MPYGSTTTPSVVAPPPIAPRKSSATGRKDASVFAETSKRLYVGKKVWIDIDNSPHVPFFLPIIHELERNGVEVVLTARDIYQVTDLLKFFDLRCKVIGGHYGKNKVLKVMGNLVRSLQLLPTASKRPSLAVNHG